MSCHREHTGVRVTMPATACATCHGDLDLKREPLDVSHRELVCPQGLGRLASAVTISTAITSAWRRRASMPPFLRLRSATISPAGRRPTARELKYPTKTGGQ